jgi:hypothetical protein
VSHSPVTHLSPATLLDYHVGKLSEEEREGVQDHLALCPECTRRLLLLDELPSVPPPREELRLTGRRLEAEWALLRERVGLAPWSRPGKPAAPTTVAFPPRPRSRPPAVWALAASLLLVTTLGLAAWVHRLLLRTTALAGPQVQLAVADLVPEGSGPRDSAPAEPAEIRWSAGTERLLLILNLADLQPFPGYRLRVTGAAGQTVWESGDLARSGNGNFFLTLPRALLPPGAYRLELRGRTGAGELRPLAEYRLRTAGP